MNTFYLYTKNTILCFWSCPNIIFKTVSKFINSYLYLKKKTFYLFEATCWAWFPRSCRPSPRGTGRTLTPGGRSRGCQAYYLVFLEETSSFFLRGLKWVQLTSPLRIIRITSFEKSYEISIWEGKSDQPPSCNFWIRGKKAHIVTKEGNAKKKIKSKPKKCLPEKGFFLEEPFNSGSRSQNA